MAENDWDVSLPINHTKIGDVPSKIRDVKSSTKQIFTKEHVTPSTDNAGGQHVKGSARVYLDSATPAVDPEGNNLDTTATADNGRVAVLTGSSNIIQVYVGTSAGVSTGWEGVACQRVYLAETMNANSKPLVGLVNGTQADEAVRLGQIDTTHLVTNSTGVISLPVIGTYLAASGTSGIAVLKTRDTQQSQAVGATDISNNTGDWADMAGMSITLTTTGGNVLLMFAATFESYDDDEILGLRFDLDDTAYCTQQQVMHDNVLGALEGQEKLISMHWLFTSLAAGEHTFKVQWKDVLYLVKQDGTSFPRVLTALEMPA